MNDTELKDYVIEQIHDKSYEHYDRLHEALKAGHVLESEWNDLSTQLSQHTEKLIEHIQFNKHLTELLDGYRDLKFSFELPTPANNPEGSQEGCTAPQCDCSYEGEKCEVEPTDPEAWKK